MITSLKQTIQRGGGVIAGAPEIESILPFFSANTLSWNVMIER